MRFKKYLYEYELNEAGGRFEYMSSMDADNHRTIKGLMKNNGIFKSMKQRWYLLEKQWKYKKIGGKFEGGDETLFRKTTDLKQMRGITTAKEGDYVVEVNAAMIFGGGRKQGFRRLEWGYLIDDIGVREEYKYGFEYYEGGLSSHIDKSKTKRTWQRKDNDAVKEFMEDLAQEKINRQKKEKQTTSELKASEYIGVIGERVRDIEVEVIRKNFFETQYGTSAITVMKDNDGNIIQHFGKNNLKKGDKKIVDFTVKDHEVAKVNKWNKVPYKLTSVSRVKVK